jgi:hypothetical protein
MNIRRQELVHCEEMIERHVTEFTGWLEGGTSARPLQLAPVPTSGRTEG